MSIFDAMGDWIDRKTGRTAPPPVATPSIPTVSAPVITRPPVSKAKLAVWVGVAVVLAMWFVSPKPGSFAPAPTFTGAGLTPSDERTIATSHPPVRVPPPPNPDANLAAQQQAMGGGPTTGLPPGYGYLQSQQSVAAVDPAAQERDRLRKSLFASPVIVGDDTPAPVGNWQQAAVAAPVQQESGAQAKAGPPSNSHRRDCLDTDQDGERLYAVCEGTAVDLVLNNRLSGDFTGPVVTTLSDDVYSRDRSHLLLPKGTRVLGRADRVDQANQSRLVVKFHRILFENGRGYALNDTPGLNQAGDSALKADKINRHLLATFSASVALGALAGFSQFGTGGYYNANGVDMYRQGVASNLGQTAQQMAQQNMNQRRPTIEVTEGHPIKLFLEEDLLIPEYQVIPAIRSSFGGER